MGADDVRKSRSKLSCQETLQRNFRELSEKTLCSSITELFDDFKVSLSLLFGVSATKLVEEVFMQKTFSIQKISQTIEENI